MEHSILSLTIFFILLKGIFLGISIAAPVGPIGFLCIQRTLNKGRVAGLVTGLGAATADGIYGIIAGLGLTAVSQLLINNKIYIGLIGGIFLCYLGIKTILTKSKEKSESDATGKYLNYYISTFFLTLTNPMTILSFIGIFAGLGIVSGNGNWISSIALIIGVFLGSATWWFLLSFGLGYLKNILKDSFLSKINIVSGSIISIFGVVSIIHSLFDIR